MDNSTPPQLPTKKGMGAGAKWGLGCGCGCLVVLILLILGGVFGVKLFMRKVDQMAAEMKTVAGIEEEISGQVLEITTPITTPTLYKGQVVKLLANCSTNVAVLAQVGEIHGTIEGRLYFRGQILTIQPSAELRGGLDATAQIVQNYGEVFGRISGEHRFVDMADAAPDESTD